MMAFTFVDGLLFSLLSIFIVITLIILIIILISPLQKLTDKPINKEPYKKIKDYDMMVAALIASIEFKKNTDKEPYLKRIKEITDEDL
ncbi:MAG: hypothetical protein K9L64_06835 [Candidatus Izimaplasma sp.]|nr:hypothetical protein [Candidatus Izimaplasma bacterium]